MILQIISKKNIECLEDNTKSCPEECEKEEDKKYLKKVKKNEEKEHRIKKEKKRKKEKKKKKKKKEEDVVETINGKKEEKKVKENSGNNIIFKDHYHKHDNNIYLDKTKIIRKSNRKCTLYFSEFHKQSCDTKCIVFTNSNYISFSGNHNHC